MNKKDARTRRARYPRRLRSGRLAIRLSWRCVTRPRVDHARGHDERCARLVRRRLERVRRRRPAYGLRGRARSRMGHRCERRLRRGVRPSAFERRGAGGPSGHGTRVGAGATPLRSGHRQLVRYDGPPTSDTGIGLGERAPHFLRRVLQIEFERDRLGLRWSRLFGEGHLSLFQKAMHKPVLIDCQARLRSVCGGSHPQRTRFVGDCRCVCQIELGAGTEPAMCSRMRGG